MEAGLGTLAILRLEGETSSDAGSHRLLRVQGTGDMEERKKKFGSSLLICIGTICHQRKAIGGALGLYEGGYHTQSRGLLRKNSEAT